MGKKKLDQNSSNQDIMKLVRAANKELHLTEGEMHAEAESIFQSVGKTLKKRREIDDHEVMTSYLKEDQNVDPAHGDTELEKRLQEQAELGKKKMSEYMDNFYRENVIQRKDKEEEEDREDDLYKTKEIEDRFKDHSVFVGYAPIENPKYIVSVIIENGGSGSAVAAPIAHKILNFAYQENV